MSWITVKSHLESSSSCLTIIISDGSLVWIRHLSITLRNNSAKDAGAAACWENEIVLIFSYIYMNDNEAGARLAERLEKSSLIKSDRTSRQHVPNKRADIRSIAFIKDLGDSLFKTSCSIWIHNDEWQTYLSREEEPRLWSFCISLLQEEKTFNTTLWDSLSFLYFMIINVWRNVSHFKRELYCKNPVNWLVVSYAKQCHTVV